MARTALIALAMLWTGCSAAARLGVTTRSTATATAGDPVTAQPGDPTAATGPDAQPFPGQIVQRQVAELVGLTVDQARQKLRQFGHDGAVKVVRLDRYMSGCAPERVCNVGPTFSFGVHDEVQLWLNPRLDIAAPQP
jgi:hypothetical protein